MHEELSTYADEVFESPSEAAVKEAEPSSKKDETELTGSALDKTELERSHLMLWVATGFVSEAVLIILTWIFIPGKQFSHEKCKRYESDSSVSLDQCFQKSKYNRQYKKQYINWQATSVGLWFWLVMLSDIIASWKFVLKDNALSDEDIRLPFISDLWSEGGVKPKKELDHQRCPCGRRSWVFTDSGVGSALLFLSRSFLPERNGLMAWAWWGNSQTAPTASALTATSRDK